MLYLLWIDYSTDPGFYYKDIDYVFLVYNIVIYCIAHHTKWLHFRIGLFSNFQVDIFDWKITHSKTWYVKIIFYTCFLRVYMHVNVHTYHIHELIYNSLTGLYSIIFGQINYAIISANTPYSVPLLLYKINIFTGIRFMISSLYNITYYMSILILCFPDLNNYFVFYVTLVCMHYTISF